MVATVQHRRFTVAEYHRLAEVGVLTEDDRTELIDGELIVMCPMGSRHAAICDRLVWILARRLEEDRFILRDQTPVALGERDEPEPDLSLARFRADGYVDGLPQAEDLVLVIEVSDTSYDYDRTQKLPRYAEARVPEVWIVDIERRRIEVHRAPVGNAYTEMRLIVGTGTVAVPSSAAVIGLGDLASLFG